jgi:2'-5' RNA ligase
MMVYAALVPPPDVLDRVRQVVDGVAPSRQPEPVPVRRGLLRRRETPPPPPPPAPMLNAVPATAMHLVVAKFGNLVLNDAMRLANALDAEAWQWPTPRLRLTGGVALEPEGDDGVWVPLDGDLHALNDLRQGVTRVAQGLQLFVDRRGFRPQVQVGTVNGYTTEAYLEELLAALRTFESNAWWQTTISLLQPADHGPGQATFRTFRDIALGPAVEH